MSGWSGLLALWLVFSGATVAGFLWAASCETVADIDEPDEPDTETCRFCEVVDEPDAETCPACKVADDPTLTSLDLTLWAIEMEGAL